MREGQSISYKDQVREAQPRRSSSVEAEHRNLTGRRITSPERQNGEWIHRPPLPETHSVSAHLVGPRCQNHAAHNEEEEAAAAPVMVLAQSAPIIEDSILERLRELERNPIIEAQVVPLDQEQQALSSRQEERKQKQHQLAVRATLVLCFLATAAIVTGAICGTGACNSSSKATADMDVDGCDPDPCIDGTCVDDGDGTYTCECFPGFEGTDCDVNIDDCPAVNACSGHGICIDGINAFTCNCDPGWSGTDCDFFFEELSGDIMGSIRFFRGGNPMPVGNYSTWYTGGCFKYQSSQDWTVHAFVEPDHGWWLAGGASLSASVQRLPGTVGIFTPLAYASYYDCVVANLLLDPIHFLLVVEQPLGVWLEDIPHYSDNVPGPENPTWVLSSDAP